MKFITTNRHNKQNQSRYLIRGDSEGYVLVWSIPDISTAQLEEISKQKPLQPVVMTATLTTSLSKAWESMNPDPVGILDQLDKEEGQCEFIQSFFFDKRCYFKSIGKRKILSKVVIFNPKYKFANTTKVNICQMSNCHSFDIIFDHIFA